MKAKVQSKKAIIKNRIPWILESDNHTRTNQFIAIVPCCKLA